MSPVLTVVISIVVLIVGIAIGYVLRRNLGEKAIGSAEQQARNMILDAQNTVESLKKEKVLEAKEEIHKLRDEYEGELKARRAEVSKAERRILQKEENIDKKLFRILGLGNAVYTALDDSSSPSTKKSVSSVADYYKKNLISWENLSGSKQELYNLKNKIFKGERIAIFEQEKASERTMKELSQSGELALYSQILIACHGYFNAAKPELSALVFSEVSHDGEKSGEDGYLTIDEISLLKMNAEFLNLSACQTGLSALKKGDGMLGLTRSCIVAGAHTVGVTLWEVHDTATCVFQEYLYGFIKNGVPYATAYQNAKQKMKESEEWSNPVYWAAFVLYE